MTDSLSIELEVNSNVVDVTMQDLKTLISDSKFILDNSDQLSQKEVEVLLLLIKKNEPLLNSLFKIVSDITKDNVVNAQDIPYLITFIKDMYTFLHSIKKDLKLHSADLQKMIPNLVKFLISFILKTNTKISAENLILLENLINSSMEVLSLTSNLKIKKCNLNNMLSLIKNVSLKKNIA